MVCKSFNGPLRLLQAVIKLVTSVGLRFAPLFSLQDLHIGESAGLNCLNI